jgi:hypothetical protein
MGIIRGGLVSILAIILFINIILMNSLLTLTFSLDYNNVKQEITNATQQILQGELGITDKIKTDFEKMILNCQNNADYVFNYAEYTFAIDCSVISQGEQRTLDKIIENTVKTLYYKKYDCTFFECLKNSEYPFFLISEQSKDYIKNKLYLTIISALILIAAIFLIMEDKLDLPILVGGELILSSLPFAKLNSLLSGVNNQYLKFLTVFFENSYDVFLISFIAGVIILSIGIILKVLNWNSIKKKFSKEEVKEMIKEEITKNSKPKEVSVTKKVPAKKEEKPKDKENKKEEKKNPQQSKKAEPSKNKNK